MHIALQEVLRADTQSHAYSLAAIIKPSLRSPGTILAEPTCSQDVPAKALPSWHLRTAERPPLHESICNAIKQLKLSSNADEQAPPPMQTDKEL